MTALEKEKVTLKTAVAIEEAAKQARAVSNFLSLLWFTANAMDGDAFDLERFADIIDLMGDAAREAASTLTVLENIEIIKEEGAAVNV